VPGEETHRNQTDPHESAEHRAPRPDVAAGECRHPTVARRVAVAETAGALTGVYEHRYLETLRKDWPA
jgi:hypothetical protein